jgi:hypothetical protein
MDAGSPEAAQSAENNTQSGEGPQHGKPDLHRIGRRPKPGHEVRDNEDQVDHHNHSHEEKNLAPTRCWESIWPVHRSDRGEDGSSRGNKTGKAGFLRRRAIASLILQLNALQLAFGRTFTEPQKDRFQQLHAGE